ncbi:hypothetical protein CSHISOI_10202, partial [Colletotrichum shisoi]
MARPEISRPKSAHTEDKRWTVKALSQRLSSHQGERDAYSAASDSRPGTRRTSTSSKSTTSSSSSSYRGKSGERRKTSGSSLSQDDGYVIEKPSKFITDFGWPTLPDPLNPNKKLRPRQLTAQRICFILVVFLLNIGLAAVACFGDAGLATLVFILFVKCKDFLSSLLSLVCQTGTSIYRRFRPPAPVSQRGILLLIPAYSESEEQLVKTVYSLRDNGNIKTEFSRACADIERPYHSLKYKKSTLRIKAGFMQDVPVIVIEKVKNSGKKDSLVLMHELFNAPRDSTPTYTRLLREEVWRTIFPALTEGTGFRAFSMIFCTDAVGGDGAPTPYLNNYFYFAGENMILVTRIAAAIDIARQTLVCYRVLNTILCIRALVHSFHFLDVHPLLVVRQFPVIWFCVCLAVEAALGQRAHKIVLGFFVNNLVSPFMSMGCTGEDGHLTPGWVAYASTEA